MALLSVVDLLCIASQSSPCTRVPSFDAFLHQGPNLFLRESLDPEIKRHLAVTDAKGLYDSLVKEDAVCLRVKIEH